MEILLVWLVILIAFFGARILILKKDWAVSDKTARVLLIIHLVPIAFYIACMVMSFYHLSFRGYRSSSIIFIITILTGVPFYLLRKKTFLLPVLNIILIPICSFSVPLMTFCAYEILVEYKKDVYYEDDRYRLQDTFGGIMAARSLPDLFIKNGILEKRYRLNEPYLSDIVSVRITKEPSDSICIRIHHARDEFEERPDPYIIRIKE